MKIKVINLLLVLLLGCIPCIGAENIIINSGSWQIDYQPETGTLNYIYQGQMILAGVFVQAKDNGIVLKSSDYENVDLKSEPVSDVFGSGTKYTLTYSGLADKADLEQIFYFYPDKDYFLTEVYLVSQQETSSNYIAPVMTHSRNSFLPSNKQNRILSIPFDNDGWVSYSSFSLNRDSVSFEVTCAYDGDSRRGFILGSVEHDTWKTGIRYSAKEDRYIDKLECFGGIVHRLTNDVYTDGSRPSLNRHGSIYGKRLKSPKIFIGLFEDWRRGMETFGEANALVTPPRRWDKGNIFGWNSWGSMQKGLNYEGVTDVSDFIKEELMPNNFSNDGTVYIILDSYWDNLTLFNLKKFADHCKANGQVPGIYWAPFSNWNPQDGGRQMEGSSYKFEDAYLHANGQPRWIASGSRALDPTHPGTQARMKYQIGLFKQMGYKYIKIDFINNAALEADSYYDKTVTTGMQAYNKGMQYLCDLCGDDMFITLSIAPAFPSQYGNARRISCDAYSSANDSKYVLNCLSFGWWLDRVYNFNDADHLVLDGPEEKVNRMRITTGVITGNYVLGDNFSQKGSAPGTMNARERAKRFATNAAINDIARIGRSFFPVEGCVDSGANTDELFMIDTENSLYLAIFNFSRLSKDGAVDLSRLGLLASEVSGVRELWSDTDVALNGEKLPYNVALNDVKVFKINKHNSSGVGVLTSEDETDKILTGYVSGNTLMLNANTGLKWLGLYSSDGILLERCPVKEFASCYEINVSSLTKGLFIVKAITDSCNCEYLKFLK